MSIDWPSAAYTWLQYPNQLSCSCSFNWKKEFKKYSSFDLWNFKVRICVSIFVKLQFEIYGHFLKSANEINMYCRYTLGALFKLHLHQGKRLSDWAQKVSTGIVNCGQNNFTFFPIHIENVLYVQEVLTHFIK